jgi:hypothetical protein
MNIDDVWYSVIMCIILIYSSFVWGRNSGYRKIIVNIEKIIFMSEHSPAIQKPYYGPGVFNFDRKISPLSYLFIVPAAMLLWILWQHLEDGFIISILLFFFTASAHEWGLLNSKKLSKIIISKHYPMYYKTFKDNNPNYTGKDSDIYLDYIRLQAEVCGTKDELPYIPTYQEY